MGLIDIHMIVHLAYVNLCETTPGPRPSRIEYSCNATASDDYGIKFSVVAMERETSITVFTSALLSCVNTNPLELEIINITCNTEYLVSAQFTFPNGSLTTCPLSNIATISEDCPTSDAPPAG